MPLLEVTIPGASPANTSAQSSSYTIRSWFTKWGYVLWHPAPLLKVNLPGASSVGIGALAKILAPLLVVRLPCASSVLFLGVSPAPSYSSISERQCVRCEVPVLLG